MGLSGARTYLFMLLITCRQAHWLRLATTCNDIPFENERRLLHWFVKQEVALALYSL